MKRNLVFIYGLSNHIMFLLVYACMAAFVGNFLLPKTIDSPVTGSPAAALAINLALLVGFGLQHSIMARPAFKKWWTQFVPEPMERSTYVLFSNIAVILMLPLWQPMDATIWDVQSHGGRILLWSLFVAGWLMVPAVTLLINHLDLFGVRQVWLHMKGREYTHLPFRTPLAYNRVRHPLYVGWMIAFWATPTMSLGHLLFAAVLTGYMLIAIQFEERNLVEHFGREYEDYRKQVPMLIPLPGRSARTDEGKKEAAVA